MTIKTATITNFQSHKKTVLHFHKGVNAIVGSSDCGKSAILRALGWTIRNKSDDRDFRSHWGGKCDVELVFDDGKEVSRVQDKHNCYYLVDPANKVDEEYKAFKSDIPEDIAQALNMDSINIQSQFDAPFLLAESSGDVAKLLNKIANLSDIDESVSNIKGQVLKNARDISTSESVIATLQEQLKTFNYIEDMEKDVSHWEQLTKQSVDVMESAIDLNIVLNNIENSQKELAEIDSFLKAEQGCAAALTLVEQEKVASGQIRMLEATIRLVEERQVVLNEIENLLEAEELLNETLAKQAKLGIIQKQGEELQALIKTIVSQQVRLESDSTCIKQLEQQFSKNFPTTCPLCDQEVV